MEHSTPETTAPDRHATPATTPYSAPEIISLGDGESLIKSQSHGSYLDGDSDTTFRHKPA